MRSVDFFLLSKRSLDTAARVQPARLIGQALDWNRGPTLDCLYRGSGGSGTSDECSVAVPIDEIQCFNQNEGCVYVHCACGDQLSTLADSKRSPAIDRRVSVEMNLSSVATVEPNDTVLNSMNAICLVDSGRRYATRDALGFQARAKSAGLCSIAAIAAGGTAVRGQVFGCQADR